MNLASDNVSGVSREVLEAIVAANHHDARAYGADDWSSQLLPAFRALFEHEELIVFPVFNGSAANCAALASLMRPYEAVIAHQHSHIQQDECGMPEFFTGAKVLGIPGINGKMEPLFVSQLIERAANNGVHHSRPKALSITQSTEYGTVYSPEETASLCAIAHDNGLYVHMDGARFANAVVSTGSPPADLTWRAGVDVLSFGCTKNGAMLAEAVIFFRPELAEDFAYIQKRSGQLASKQRYLSAQLLAMLENDLWLKNARTANEAAQHLARNLNAISGMTILNPVKANSIFVKWRADKAQKLLAKGHIFYRWPVLGEDVYRLVTNFQTTIADVNAFIADCRE